MKIVIVSQCPTHPTNAGNRTGIINQVEALKANNVDVYFLYIYDRPLLALKENEVELKALSDYWRDHLYIYRVPKFRHVIQLFIQRFRDTFNHGWLKCDDLFPPGIVRFLKKINMTEHFDGCIVNYYFLSKLLAKTSLPAKAIMTHDYFAYKTLLVGKKSVGYATTAHEEAIAVQRCQHVFAVNTEEAIYYSKLSPRSSIYNIFSHFEYKSSPIANNKNLLFFSGSNEYNINGLNWFLEEVFPFIINKWPDVKLVIGGGICSKLKGLNNSNIELTGYVDDPSEFYQKGDVVINPTYEGTGLKIKTFEAISYDKVVLAHPHSISGMFDIDSIPVFASTSPIAWVEYLQMAWENKDFIGELKSKNEKYLKSLNSFIDSEYKRFLNSIEL